MMVKRAEEWMSASWSWADEDTAEVGLLRCKTAATIVITPSGLSFFHVFALQSACFVDDPASPKGRCCQKGRVRRLSSSRTGAVIDEIGTSSSATVARQHWRLLIDFIMHPICTPGLYSRWYSSIAAALWKSLGSVVLHTVDVQRRLRHQYGLGIRSVQLNVMEAFHLR